MPGPCQVPTGPSSSAPARLRGLVGCRWCTKPSLFSLPRGLAALPAARLPSWLHGMQSRAGPGPGRHRTVLNPSFLLNRLSHPSSSSTSHAVTSLPAPGKLLICPGACSGCVTPGRGRHPGAQLPPEPPCPPWVCVGFVWSVPGLLSQLGGCPGGGCASGSHPALGQRPAQGAAGCLHPPEPPHHQVAWARQSPHEAAALLWVAMWLWVATHPQQSLSVTFSPWPPPLQTYAAGNNPGAPHPSRALAMTPPPPRGTAQMLWGPCCPLVQDL